MNHQKASPAWALYTTSSCHLCEQAEQLLAQVGLAFDAVEIADDPALLERYGVRIPVLRRRDTGEELNWPFNAVVLHELL